MFSWLRKGPSPHRTTIAMIGVKSGNQLALVGAREPDLAAELALVTGLNGQTTVFDEETAAEARLAAAAARAGSLVDFVAAPASSLPVADGSQDVVVVLVPLAPLGDDVRRAVIGEAMRALRDGGRLVVVDGARATGVFGGGGTRDRVPADQVVPLLQGAGARAARLLAEADGVGYFEARK